MKLSAGYINTVYSTCRYSGRSASNWEFLFLSFLGVEFTSELELDFYFDLLCFLYFTFFTSCFTLVLDSLKILPLFGILQPSLPSLSGYFLPPFFLPPPILLPIHPLPHSCPLSLFCKLSRRPIVLSSSTTNHFFCILSNSDLYSPMPVL